MRLFSRNGTITPKPPFDFSKSIDALWLFNQLQGEQSLAAHRFIKAFCVGEEVVACSISASGTIEAPELEYTLFSHQPIEAETEAEVLRRVDSVLSLSEDLSEFYAIASADPAFSPIHRRLYGYHPVKFATPYEAVCWTILTQRSLIPIAQKLRHAFVRNFGKCIIIDDDQHWGFPDPASVIQVPLADLVECLGDDKRAQYLLDAARAFHAAEQGFFQRASYKTIEDWLLEIKGVGFSSAAYVLTRGFGRVEQVRFTDKKLMGIVKKVYSGTQQISREEIPKIAEKYGPWQGYWACYLREAEPFVSAMTKGGNV